MRAVPLAGTVVNMIVAGSFVAAIGEGTRYIFEQIYLGKKSVEDIDWVEKVLDEKLSGGFIDKVKNDSATLNEMSSKEDVAKAIELLTLLHCFSIGVFCQNQSDKKNKKCVDPYLDLRIYCYSALILYH